MTSSSQSRAIQYSISVLHRANLLIIKRFIYTMKYVDDTSFQIAILSFLNLLTFHYIHNPILYKYAIHCLSPALNFIHV